MLKKNISFIKSNSTTAVQGTGRAGGVSYFTYLEFTSWALFIRWQKTEFDWGIIAMGLSRHIGSHFKQSCYDIIELSITKIWLNCLPHWTCLSNFCVSDSLIICKWGLPEETLYFLIYFLLLCCCCFSILKYYIYPWSFSSVTKKQLCLGELCQRVLNLKLSGILSTS